MKLTHPESKQAVEVRTKADAETYLSQGWEDAGKKSADSDDA